MNILKLLTFATHILSSKNPAEAAIDWGLIQAAGTEKGALLVQVVNPLIEESKKLDKAELESLVLAIVAIETGSLNTPSVTEPTSTESAP